MTTPDRTRSIRRIVPVAVLALVGSLAVTGYLGYAHLTSQRADQAPAAEGTIVADYGPLVDFTLTTQHGTPLSRDDLRGNIWLADFIFTYCAGPCPLMTARMAELQKALADIDALRLVSFSVDPDRDTPEVLKEYGDRYGADHDRWTFLTGDIVTIMHVAIEGFAIGDREDPILHSTLFALVDQRGHIRGYYHSDEPELIDKIRHDLDILRREDPA
ncbi:MAG TPA: SCO family protein [candidate division Zixibacteria bacterium]|jgi:protein SCO1/2